MAASEKRIAKITDTWLGIEDHGVFGFNIGLDFGDYHQSFGFYGLGHTDHTDHTIQEWVPDPRGLEALRGILLACGVERWEKLVGRTVFAIVESGMVRGLEPLPTERGERFHIYDLWPQ